MGRSSPPFLYGPPASHSFSGPTDRPFNPKAVTEASRTRPAPKPKPKGPLVSFNRHPDSYSIFPDGKSRWTPMSPRTKGRVLYGRKVQLALRILALLGALGSLFCAIVIKNILASIVWIIRVGPAVAILHSLYGIYHLCRSPIGRPAGTQASYWVFASTFDLGLVPFYVFAAFIAYKEWTTGFYHWESIFKDSEITHQIATVTFILSVVNGGLHAISFGISVSLAVMFRHINQLPPDLNPLEDNLTARPHKRNKSELAEKHNSQYTLDTAMSEDPLIGTPRSVPFTHTRNRSSGGNLSHFSDMNEKRQSQGSFNPDQLPYEEPPMPGIPPCFQNYHPNNFLQVSAQEMRNISVQPPSSTPRNASLREASFSISDRSQCVSPESGNWVTYGSRSVSPVSTLQEPQTQDENMARRDPSSNYSRSETPLSTTSGANRLASARYGWDIGETITEDVRGEYESLAMQEFYGDDDDAHYAAASNGFYDNTEKDLGDHRINIYHDNEDDEDVHDSLPINPLGLNPPTPQPILNGDNPNNPRNALADIPNLSPTPPVGTDMDSPEKNKRFYGELEGPGLSVPRVVSGQDKPYSDEVGRKKSKLLKKKSQKKNTYGALKQHDSDSDGEGDKPEPTPAINPTTTDSDRKGRVVSNSGADYSARNIPTSGLSSYGSYIAGLGVGRRRDVSGKMAEEGRSGTGTTENNMPQRSTPVRAAGWARFAGL